jgi:hypothetical protein
MTEEERLALEQANIEANNSNLNENLNIEVKNRAQKAHEDTRFAADKKLLAACGLVPVKYDRYYCTLKIRLISPSETQTFDPFYNVSGVIMGSGRSINCNVGKKQFDNWGFADYRLTAKKLVVVMGGFITEETGYVSEGKCYLYSNDDNFIIRNITDTGDVTDDEYTDVVARQKEDCKEIAVETAKLDKQFYITYRVKYNPMNDVHAEKMTRLRAALKI